MTCVRLMTLPCAHGSVAVASLIPQVGWPFTQVRCIAAVLLLVGRGQEAPSVVARLLDVQHLPGKPQYCLAPEVRRPSFVRLRGCLHGSAGEQGHEHVV